MNTKKKDKDKDKKKPCNNKPNHNNLPIDIEVFNRIFNEAYTRVSAEFIDEEAITKKVSVQILDTLDGVLDHHVDRATRQHLKESYIRNNDDDEDDYEQDH